MIIHSGRAYGSVAGASGDLFRRLVTRGWFAAAHRLVRTLRAAERSHMTKVTGVWYQARYNHGEWIVSFGDARYTDGFHAVYGSAAGRDWEPIEIACLAADARLCIELTLGRGVVAVA